MPRNPDDFEHAKHPQADLFRTRADAPKTFSLVVSGQYRALHAPNNNPCCHGKQRMRGFRWVDEIAKTGSWTCHRCLRGGQNKVAHLATYTTNAGKLPPWTLCAQRASQLRRSSYGNAILEDFTLGRYRSSIFPSNRPTIKDSSAWNNVFVSKGKRRGLMLAILAVGLIWALSNDASHRYMASKRVLRVFIALVRCVREYVLPPSVIRHLQQC